MSVDAESATLGALVPDGMLGRPSSTDLLLWRQRTLLSLTSLTPVAQLEAWAICRLLETGTIGSGEILRQLLEWRDWGANFDLIDEHAPILNPLIGMQRTVWNNLTAMVRDGEVLPPPMPLDSYMAGQHVPGYTLYQQQTMLSGARQSVDRNALAMLADTLAGAVITTHEKIRGLKSSGKLILLDRYATHLAWHTAVLRDFVVAAIKDPDMPLQRQLLEDTVVRGFVLLALQTVSEPPNTINEEGSSANPNVEVSSEAGGDLSMVFFDSIQKAADSPLS